MIFSRLYKFLTVTILSSSLLFPASVYAQAKSEPLPPEKTLQAPFPTNAPATAPKSALMDIYDSANGSATTNNSDVNLAIAHRNEQEIIEWATDIVTQALTINLSTYDADFKKIEPFFAPFALKEYQDYLAKVNMVSVLSSNSFRLQAISDSMGVVIKDGEIAGAYRWLVQVPLMASYYKINTQRVDKNTNIQSKKMVVQVQIGRVVPKTNTDIGLVIERWSVSGVSK
jgi:hypothetical protein